MVTQETHPSQVTLSFAINFNAGLSLVLAQRVSMTFLENDNKTRKFEFRAVRYVRGCLATTNLRRFDWLGWLRSHHRGLIHLLRVSCRLIINGTTATTTTTTATTAVFLMIDRPFIATEK